MKIKSLLIATILLQLFAVSYFAQDVESILIDSFSFANREDMMARIDNFTVELQNKPSAKGYIITKGSKSSRSFAEKEIKSYLKMRAFDMKNVVFLNGEGDKMAAIELWLVPPGAKLPAIEKKSKNEPQAIFSDSFSYTNREDMMLRIDSFTLQLQNDPSAKGYIVIRGKKPARIAAEKEIRDYIKMRLFDLNRLVFLSSDGDKTAEIDLWLVPQGAKPPTPEKSVNQNNTVKTQIIALEKQAWESWKNKDVAFFQTFLADDALSVNSSGVFDKPQILEYYGSCDVKSFSLDNFKFRILDKNSALITFTGIQDAVCGGEKTPSTVRVSSVYVKSDGKWLNSFYMETPLHKDNSSTETQIIALEKQAWEEWKKGNRKFVENYLADDAVFVYSEGVVNKSQVVEAVGSCKFNSYSLDDFKVINLSNTSALVTYTATQDIICDGNPAPKAVRSTSVYVKSNGKWRSTFYTETAEVK